MPSEFKKPLLLSIVGPTAVGKTALSVRLAKHFNAPIISADSRQMYKHISIGTAKPNLDEQSGVPHHFLDFLELEEEYSAGQFEREALDLIVGRLQKVPVIILCGGSGLYVKAVLEGLDEIPKDDSIRNELIFRYETKGLPALVEELEQLDPKAHAHIDKNNPQRIIRALEVCLTSGEPFSSFHKHEQRVRPFRSLVIGLRRERKELNERIVKRCQEMFISGWLEEAETVFEKRHLNSLNTVGYKEIFQHLLGETSLEECQETVVRETQRFAKRQMTWFNRTRGIEWVSLPHPKIDDAIIQRAEDFIDT